MCKNELLNFFLALEGTVSLLELLLLFSFFLLGSMNLVKSLHPSLRTFLFEYFCSLIKLTRHRCHTLLLQNKKNKKELACD